MPINLAPKETLEESPFWKKFIFWSINAGRIIIIGTQIVVLSAFFARFFLDRQIIDLSEEIKTKQMIIKSTAGLESKFRTTQDQLAAIKTLKGRQNTYSKTLKNLTQKFPKQVSVQKIHLKEGVLDIQGRAESGGGFAQFLIMLATSENVEQVALEGASITPEGRLSFNLSIENAPAAYRTQPNQEQG